MNHVVKRHPHHMDACTQFSIAMAYDIPLDVVTKELGFGAVTTAQLRRYLVRMGLSATGDSLDDAGAVTEGKGIMIIHGGYEGHAVAFEDGKIYDPNGHTFDSVESLLHYYTTHTSRTWTFYTLFQNQPLKYRKWTVGKKKEEAI